MSLEGAACSFYSSEQSLLTWPLSPLGQKLAGTGLSGCAEQRRRAGAVVATDTASVDADHDNGAALHGSAQFR